MTHAGRQERRKESRGVWSVEGRGKRANNRVVTGRQQMKAGEEWAGVGAAGRGASEQASLLASEIPVGWRWLGG